MSLREETVAQCVARLEIAYRVRPLPPPAQLPDRVMPGLTAEERDEVRRRLGDRRGPGVRP